MIYNNDKLIAAAFVKARAAIGGTVGKDAKGNFGRYATLAAITEATSAALSANGLAVIQEAQLDDAGVTIMTTLLHESGATMQFTPLTMPLTDRKPQAVGSAITYGRRYALAAVCGLAPDDDDGQAAQDATKPTQKPVDVEFSKSKPQLANAAQIATIGALGAQVYGDTWKDEQGHLSEWASQGARKALVDLYEMEAEKLIRGLQKKVAA